MKTLKKESEIVREICEHLEKEKWFFWRQNNIPVFGRNNAGQMTWRALPKFCIKGVPDIIIISDGIFIGLEVKREGQKQKPEQVLFQKRVEENGGKYFLVDSVDNTIKALLSI